MKTRYKDIKYKSIIVIPQLTVFWDWVGRGAAEGTTAVAGAEDMAAASAAEAAAGDSPRARRRSCCC